MRIFIATITLAALTGCGTYGEPLWLARIADANDPCQLKSYDYRPPSFCGASAGKRFYTRDYRTGGIIYVTQ